MKTKEFKVNKDKGDVPSLQKFFILYPKYQLMMIEYSIVGLFFMSQSNLILGWGMWATLVGLVACLLVIAAFRGFWWWYDKKNRKSFAGDVVLVTGGAKGLGKEICREILKNEKKIKALVIWDVDKVNLQATVSEFKEYCSLNKNDVTEIMGQIVDISSYKQMEENGKEILERFGSVDVLINNAGIFSKKRIVDTTPEILEKVMSVNVLSHLYSYKIFLPNMIKKKHGHLVCISSSTGCIGGATPQEYAASKFASFGALESLRMDLKHYYKLSKEIRTLIMCPHVFDSDLFSNAKSFTVKRLKMKDIAVETYKAMQNGREVVNMPKYFAWVFLHRYIGAYWVGERMWYGDWWQKFLGIHQFMDLWDE